MRYTGSDVENAEATARAVGRREARASLGCGVN
jgi:hypothetical protein